MSAEPRRFQLHRDADVSGVSGVGVVADGVVFPDGHAAIHWRGDWPTTTPHPSMESVIAVHGHGGATRVVWLDIPTPPAPDYASVWVELRGYVMEAVAGGETISPPDMLRYLDELQRKAHGIGREWLKDVLAGAADQSGQAS